MKILGTGFKRKLIYGFAILILPFLIGAGLSLYQVHSLLVGSQSALKTYIPLLKAVKKAETHIIQGHFWTAEAASGKKKVTLKDIRRHYEEARWYLEALLQGGERDSLLVSSIQKDEIVREIEQALAALDRLGQMDQTRYRQQDDDPMLTEKSAYFFQKILGHINQAQLHTIPLISSALNEVDKKYSRVILIAIVTLAVTIPILFSLAVFLSNKLTRPLNELVTATRRYQEGDFDFRFEYRSDDEIGVLTRAFNDLAKKICEAQKELEAEKQSVEQRVESAIREISSQREELSRNVERILEEMEKFAEGDLTAELEVLDGGDIGRLYSGFNRAVQNIRDMMMKVVDAVNNTLAAGVEINQYARNLSEDAEQQSTQTIQVASAIEEMSSNISETTQNTTRIAEAAKESGEHAREGSKVIVETINAFDDIREFVVKSARTIQSLSARSNQIGKIIQVIDEIADQTNLLALNAAIEAARAGDHGKGFAVVADEVRKLAERTSQATKDIEKMIKQIQKETQTAVTSIEKAAGEAESGKALIDKADNVLVSIVSNVENVSERISQVAVAMEQQKQTSEEITRSIEEISRRTQSQSSGIKQIVFSANSLKDLMEDLKSQVEQFKIQREDQAEVMEPVMAEEMVVEE